MKKTQAQLMKELFTSIRKHIPLTKLAATAVLCGCAGMLNGGEEWKGTVRGMKKPSLDKTEQVQQKTQPKADPKTNIKNEVEPTTTLGKPAPTKETPKDNKKNEVKQPAIMGTPAPDKNKK